MASNIKNEQQWSLPLNPMINLGTKISAILVIQSIKTADNLIAAYFEHNVALIV